MVEKGKEAKAKKKNIKIEGLEKERDEMLSGWQRCRADFLNYKKDEGERIKKLIDYEKEEWLLELLQILDHFERAKAEVSRNSQEPSRFDGFFQIQKSLESFARKQGLEEIRTEIGEKFDPNFEEVIETKEDKEKEEGTILKIIQKGYKFKEKVIRPARVKVSKKVEDNNN